MTQSAQPQHMVTRFAPSPTGRLHVGHAWSALLAMDLAHARGGSFRLRIEDIDGTRSRPEHVDGIVEDMRWLGIARSDERRVGQECVSTCSSRGSPAHTKKKKQIKLK